jgi:DNA-binding XRE family transcriptional regulator
MLTSEAAYRRTKGIITQTLVHLQKQEKELAAKGLAAPKVKRLLDPTRAFLAQFIFDVKSYEDAKKGKIPPIESIETIGRSLIALRIAKGMTQAELAEKLGISQGQVSQDEKDEYHAITVERAQKILSVFGARLVSKVVMDPRPRKAA